MGIGTVNVNFALEGLFDGLAMSPGALFLPAAFPATLLPKATDAGPPRLFRCGNAAEVRRVPVTDETRLLAGVVGFPGLLDASLVSLDDDATGVFDGVPSESRETACFFAGLGRSTPVAETGLLKSSDGAVSSAATFWGGLSVMDGAGGFVEKTEGRAGWALGVEAEFGVFDDELGADGGLLNTLEVDNTGVDNTGVDFWKTGAGATGGVLWVNSVRSGYIEDFSGRGFTALLT